VANTSALAEVKNIEREKPAVSSTSRIEVRRQQGEKDVSCREARRDDAGKHQHVAEARTAEALARRIS
jgi:hypothetical protein